MPNRKNTEKSIRLNVGIMIVNNKNEVFLGKRLNIKSNTNQTGENPNHMEDKVWQMPQGGIDEKEEPLAAALREAGEEAGINPELLEFIAHSKVWYEYEIPEAFVNQDSRKHTTVRQRWFLFRFKGNDSNFNLTAHSTMHGNHSEEAEFSEWKWASPDEAIENVVDFKKRVYIDVVAEFKSRIEDG